ncbi:MAG: VWA domain-containing protein, partial [Pseudomonadota bacterium]
DVSVSPAEAIDAAGAMSVVGYADKTELKSALRPTLAKSADEDAAFDRLFDLYFSRRPSETRDEPEKRDPQPSEEAPQSDDLMELAQSGDDSAIEAAMERAGRAVGAENIRFSTQTAYFAQQMLKELGAEALEADLLDRLKQRTPEADAEAEAMMDARRMMLARARSHVERQFEVFGTGATQAFREDVLTKKPIGALDRADYARMRSLVQKVAKRLATKHSKRRRRRNVGTLDVRRTLRTNAGLDGVPFQLHWKQKLRDRPKVFVLCDVSGSVARYVRFLLLLVHSLGDAIDDFRAFAFSGRLGEVTDQLDTESFESAMEDILRTYGMSSTDYGQSLSDFSMNSGSLVDRKTTLIVLGDGRSNHGDPRVDLFRDLTARAKRTIWLSPEPETMWGTGDSELPRFRPHCHSMAQVSTLQDLELPLDRVLASYQ